MKPQDLTLQQLREIVDGAPEGANAAADTQAGIQYCIWSIDKITQKWDEVWGWHHAPEFYTWHFIKLSDLRARIAELEAQKDISVTLSAESADIKAVDGSEKPVFKVGDRVVFIGAKYNELVARISSIGGISVVLDFDGRYPSFATSVDKTRHATPEEEAAGHRIDEPLISDEMASPCAVSDSAKDQAQMDLQNNEPNDFDAMSEKHRSPSCKCQEFPFDAELKPDPFPKRFNADYAQRRGLKFYATVDTETNPDSQHSVIKFDDAGREDIHLKCSKIEAIAHWENFSFRWNCYLFELMKVEQISEN